MPDTRTRRQKLEDMARRGTPPEQRAAREKLKAMGPSPKQTSHGMPFRTMEAQRGPEPVRPRGWAYLGEVEIEIINDARTPTVRDAREQAAQAAIDRIFKPFGITNRDPD